MQWSFIPISWVGSVYSGLVSQQKLDESAIATAGGSVQRRAVGRRSIHVRSVREQQFHHALVTLLCRVMKRRLTSTGPGVHVCFVFEKELRDAQLSSRGSKPESVLAADAENEIWA